jgi:hypothetical protein
VKTAQNTTKITFNSSRGELLTLVLLLATVFGLYAKMWGHNEPILDDPIQIAHVQTLGHWWECFQLDALNWFRPFKNLIFYMTLSEDGSIHLTQICSLLLFVCNSIACYTLLKNIFESSLCRIAGTAIFCLHPSMVSSR